MIKSMTGMGVGECYIDTEPITIEMKSVNHRFCDVSIKSPKILGQFDLKINRVIKSRFSRGKIDIALRMGSQNGEASFSINYESARRFHEALISLKKMFRLRGKVGLDQMIRNADLFRSRNSVLDLEAVWENLKPCILSCCDEVEKMRLSEGKEIEIYLRDGIANIVKLVTEIEKLSTEIKKATVNKMRDRLTELIGQDVEVDEQRIIQEASIWADRMDISEEINRLRGHCEHFLQLLALDEVVGRKLDFLTQEMNREANTIASKCADLRVSHLAVNLKSEIEKVREQVQNVE